jgi:type IV pilus assembly protein PilO
MRRSFKLDLPPALRNRIGRDPKLVARIILGFLLLANLIAAFFVFQPVGGSAEELERQIAETQTQVQQQQASLGRMRKLVSRIEQARTTGDDFLGKYFMDRRTASSAIVGELDAAAKSAGMKPKERSFAYDPIEGTDAFSMMTVIANYEGTYGDLLQFVNKLDKSERFLIIDTLVAAPQQNSPTLNVQIKFNAFVREAGALT